MEFKFDENKTIFVVATEMPKFMEHAFPSETKNFKYIFERAFVDLKAGTNDEGFFEIKNTYYEFANEPIAEFIQLWMSGISDPVTGARTYHGELLKNTMIYETANHTMSVVICEMVDGHIKDITKLINLIPKKYPLDEIVEDSFVKRIVHLTTDSPEENAYGYRKQFMDLYEEYLAIKNIFQDPKSNKESYDILVSNNIAILKSYDPLIRL